MSKRIELITESAFHPYGYILEPTSSNHSFQILVKEEAAVGWRLAISQITERKVEKLARHPDSFESFQPISGTALICVATTKNPEDYRIFLLDKPICLYKNIWHSTVSFSAICSLLIAENLIVTSEYHPLSIQNRVSF